MINHLKLFFKLNVRDIENIKKILLECSNLSLKIAE